VHQKEFAEEANKLRTSIMMKLKPVMAHVWEQIARYKEQLKYEEINRKIRNLIKFFCGCFFYIQGVAARSVGVFENNT